MATKPLNSSIFRLIIGIVFLTSIMIIMAVWMTTINQVEKRINYDLNIAQNVLEQVLSNRESLLINAATVLTSDFGFKQAVATADTKTIESVLLNHSQRIDADVMALISLSGKNITSTPNLLNTNENFHVPELLNTAIEDGGASALILLKGELYQVILLTVEAPSPLAITLIGFKLDKSLVEQLKEITKLETTIQVFKADNEHFAASTLNQTVKSQVTSNLNAELSWYSVTIAKDTPFTSKRFLISDNFGYKTYIILSENVETLFSEFNGLQISIIAISIAAILFAMVIAALFSKKLTEPLVMLANVAQRIAKGDYSKQVTAIGNTEEVQHLSNAFQAMQSNIKKRENEIEYRAQHDILTSLYNRYHIEKLITEKLKQKQNFTAIGINIFGFRGINDIFGYHNGDLCLAELARRVTKLSGLAARLTGGELLWIPDKNLSLDKIEIIKTSLEIPFDTGDIVINFKVALGLLHCPEDAVEAGQLFKRMNIVLDESQITRQFVLRFDQSLEKKYLRRLDIITELKNTLANEQNELSLFYQPKLNFKNNKVENVEALIRWNNAKLGFVSPEDFIAIAESAGFIGKITQWVIKQAVNDAVNFKDQGINISIAINLSARDVMNPDLLPQVKSLLSEKGLDKKHLSFEITEGDLVRDPAKAIEQLNAYREEGFLIAIDDFGTGYSSMTYLQNLPINILKVDKSFVLNLDHCVGDQNIVKTVINLAHSFNLSVVAEGIENFESLILLKEWGCEYAQGYYMCKPIDAKAFSAWYQKHKDTNWFEK